MRHLSINFSMYWYVGYENNDGTTGNQKYGTTNAEQFDETGVGTPDNEGGFKYCYDNRRNGKSVIVNLEGRRERKQNNYSRNGTNASTTPEGR